MPSSSRDTQHSTAKPVPTASPTASPATASPSVRRPPASRGAGSANTAATTAPGEGMTMEFSPLMLTQACHAASSSAMPQNGVT